jgi:nucleoid-associated protein YgaU
VVVRRSDTLWAIARVRLGSGADLAATAHEVDRWYIANRDVIGADPNLIHPGQRLVPPSKERS